MIVRFAGRLAGNTLLVLWTVLALLPFFLIVLLAFRSNTDIYVNPLGFGGTFHPENFITAWNGPFGSSGMAVFLRNSFIALVGALLVNLVLGATGAYFVTQLPQRVASWYLGLFLVGSVVPFVLVLIPYYRIFNGLGVLNNPLALGFVYGILALPTTILVLHAYFVDFPKELIEAAKIDGLGSWRVYLRVALPLSKGALTAVSLLLVIWVWSETQLAIVVLPDSPSRTAAVGILGFQGTFTANLGALFAGLTTLAIPIVVLYLIFNRFITKGIALGGVFR